MFVANPSETGSVAKANTMGVMEVAANRRPGCIDPVYLENMLRQV
jgi:hypothetical protein